MISKYAKLVEMLTRNFIKTMRRQPNNLENLKIKQQAAETIRQEQKIIPFKYKKTFGEEIKEMEEKGVGSLFKKTAETEDEILARLNKQNKDTIEKIKSRKQKTAEEIMDEGDFDPSGMATGGRVGFSKGKLVGRGITKLLERFAKDKKKSRLLTDDEIEEFAEELGDTETWMSSGTLKEAEEAAKRRKDYEQQMYSEYQVDKQGRKELEQAYKEIDFRMTGEDTKYEANELADMLAETRYKTEMSDLPQKTQLDLYDEAYNYLMEVKRDATNFKGAVDIKSGKNIVTGEQELPLDPMTGKPRKLNATGGRVGFAQGANKKMMIVDLLNKGADLDLIKTITEASDEEIMEAVDFFKYGGAGVPLPTFDDKGNMIDDGLYKGRETRPEAKAYGGRIGFSDGGNDALLEQLYEKFLDLGLSPKEAADAARKEFEQRARKAGGGIAYLMGL